MQYLQQELKRLGYDLTADGRMGQATLRAARQAMKSVGIDSASLFIPLSVISWIPAPSTVFRSCDTTLGASVAAGDKLATLGSGGQSITVKDLPSDLVSGSRIVRLGHLDIPVDANGKSVAPIPELDPSALAPASDGANATDKPISATLSLAKPIDVSSAPPSAIFDLNGPHGCVMSNGKLISVRVVGSQLGQAFIDFGQTPVPRKVELHPNSQTRCH
ncbi:peptidoglycan-binding protein [Leifsonia sp. NPDC058248]|uniref:peptidoglycan-binding domain-containing protein n=1 Tax=Leifsonia sp. NPDC058248 TaxID=3346402 RepID=UPI0036D9E1AB